MSSLRLEKQVEKLEAELKEKKAQISQEKRKERGQLVALGIMVEMAFKGLAPEGKANCVPGPNHWMPATSSTYGPRSSVWGRKKKRRIHRADAAAAGIPQNGEAHLPVSSGN